MINITKTFLPPQEKYQAILKCALSTGWMTNRGVLVQKLEVKLIESLNISNIIATTNGTIPLQIAIKALGFENAPTNNIVLDIPTKIKKELKPLRFLNG